MIAGSPRPEGSFRSRLIAFVLLAAVVLIAVQFAEPPHELTIETGPVGGSYYQDAQSYQRILATHGIDLQIRAKPNSLEIVRDVGDPQSGIDVGFVAQDVASSANSTLYSIGQIELQPLFIFASADLGRRTVLDDLRGRKIVMPPSDSATSDGAMRVLQLYDITRENSSFTMMPLADAVKQLQAGRFDVGIFMLAPESPVIRSLATDSSLHLVPIAEVKAIASHLPFLRPVLLPRGIYNIADAIPPDSTPMVAAPVGIVVRGGLHPYLLYELLDAMAKVHRAPTFLSAAGEFPTLAGSQLPVHPLALEYYRSGIPWSYRELPPWLACTMDSYHLVLIGVLLLVVFCIVAIWLADTGVVLARSLPAPWRAGMRRPTVRDTPPAASVDASGRTGAAPDAPGTSERT